MEGLHGVFPEAGGVQVSNYRTMGVIWESWVERNREVWRRQWQPTPVLLPGKAHGGREEPGRLKSMRS